MTTRSVFAGLLALAACNSANSGTHQNGDGERRSGTITVFAAASLTEAFNDLGEAFEAEHPGVDVVLSFAGSQVLRTQIEHGAQPEVYASANPRHAGALFESELVDRPSVFARNKMVLVVPRSNPAKINSFAELPEAELTILASEVVPAGTYADAVIAKFDATRSGFAAAVKDNVVSRETNVRQVLQKVVLGEADAAIVYATDAASVGDRVIAIDIPDEFNVVADYPIAAVRGASKPGLGQRFVDFVGTERGQKILQARGFVPIDE